MRAVAKTLQGRRRRKIGKGGEGEGKGSPRENPFGRGGNADFCRILFFPLSHEGVPSFLPVRQHILFLSTICRCKRLIAPSNRLQTADTLSANGSLRSHSAKCLPTFCRQWLAALASAYSPVGLSRVIAPAPARGVFCKKIFRHPLNKTAKLC